MLPKEVIKKAKAKVLKTSISNEVIKDETLLNKVIVEVTDYTLNRGSKHEPEYHTSRKVYIESEFVECFKMHFIKNGAFKDVNDAFTMYRILKNIDEKKYIRAFRQSLKSSLSNAPEDAKERFVKGQFASFKKLNLNGGSLFRIDVEGFKHVPNYDPKLANVFPENVGLASNDIYNI